MTQEQKARAYDEALERANIIYTGKYKPEIAAWTKKSLEAIFPELKESEDEKIRKELIELLNDLWEEKQGLMIDRKDYERYTAWLEKQGDKDTFIKEELECIKGYRENAIKRLKELEKQGQQKWSEED